jgi:FSR family fosmidomycin resistance protein-like MFS transporter
LAAGWIVARGGLKDIWLMAVPLLLTWPWMARWVPKVPRKRQTGSPVNWSRHLKPGLALTIFSGLRSGIIYGVSTFLPILWHDRGGSLVAAASLVTTFIGVGVAGNLGAGAVMDRFGKSVVLWGSTVLSLLLVALLPLTSGAWLWPLVGLLGITIFASLPVTMLIGQDIFSENPAMGSGVALGLANGLGALLLPLWGLLADHVGISTAMWALAGMAALSIAFIPGMRPARVSAAGSVH